MRKVVLAFVLHGCCLEGSEGTTEKTEKGSSPPHQDFSQNLCWKICASFGGLAIEKGSKESLDRKRRAKSSKDSNRSAKTGEQKSESAVPQIMLL